MINVTEMHKKIAQQRIYRELIRKWRFAALAKKITRKKLELMYKNPHASYLQTADEFLGDNNVGIFTGANPQVGEDMGKKYYSNVEKKYSFVIK